MPKIIDETSAIEVPEIEVASVNRRGRVAMSLDQKIEDVKLGKLSSMLDSFAKWLEDNGIIVDRVTMAATQRLYADWTKTDAFALAKEEKATQAARAKAERLAARKDSEAKQLAKLQELAAKLGYSLGKSE